MVLVYKCHICRNSYTLPFKANDRAELSQKYDLVRKCPNCKHENKLIVNKIKAIISPYNNYVYIIALLVGIIIGVLIFSVFDFKVKATNSPWQYYVLVLVFIIPFLIAKVSFENDLKAVQIFNRYYV